MKKTSGPAFSIPVSEKEKTQAEEIRSKFENVLRKQQALVDYLNVFFDELDDLNSSVGLENISPLVKRYEHKLKKIFNVYIKSLSDALKSYEESFSNIELDETRDLIIENVRNMRQEVIDLIVLFKDISSDQFTQESKEKHNNVLQASEQIEKIIREEWFRHIDYDILGKIKLGYNIPLTLK